MDKKKAPKYIITAIAAYVLTFIIWLIVFLISLWLSDTLKDKTFIDILEFVVLINSGMYLLLTIMVVPFIPANEASKRRAKEIEELQRQNNARELEIVRENPRIARFKGVKKAHEKNPR